MDACIDACMDVYMTVLMYFCIHQWMHVSFHRLMHWSIYVLMHGMIFHDGCIDGFNQGNIQIYLLMNLYVTYFTDTLINV